MKSVLVQRREPRVGQAVRVGRLLANQSWWHSRLQGSHVLPGPANTSLSFLLQYHQGLQRLTTLSGIHRTVDITTRLSFMGVPYSTAPSFPRCLCAGRAGAEWHLWNNLGTPVMLPLGDGRGGGSAFVGRGSGPVPFGPRCQHVFTYAWSMVISGTIRLTK